MPIIFIVCAANALAWAHEHTADGVAWAHMDMELLPPMSSSGPIIFLNMSPMHQGWLIGLPYWHSVNGFA